MMYRIQAMTIISDYIDDVDPLTKPSICLSGIRAITPSNKQLNENA
jgi:hypothetical protein